MSTPQTTYRCSPSCRCTDDNEQLYRDAEKAYEMVFKGTVDFFVIKAAYDLKLFEAMADGPREVASLAESTGTVPHRLEKLLITMQQVGLAQPGADGWDLTPFAAQFFTKSDEHRNLTMLPFLAYMIDQLQTQYVELADMVRGKVNFTSLVPFPPRTREDSIFYETIHRSNIHFVVNLLRDHAQLEGAKRLIDVGGGIGDIAAALCEKYPELNVTLLNLPSAIDLVQENAKERGLSERITPTVVDMYREPYPKGDAVLFSRILYPMNRQFCTMMLKKAAEALEPGGRVIIIDMNISDPKKPNYDYLTHYLSGIGLDFAVLEFKNHEIYPDVLREVGFTDVTLHEAYDHVLYQAVKA